MQTFEKFVLAIPYLFLKKIPYAWILVVALWSWPPVLSGIFLAIILLGLFLMKMQQRAWESKISRDFRVLYRDQPRAPLKYQIRNLALVFAGSGILGYLFHGRLGLSGLQWFLLLSGVMLLYKDALLLGASTVYLVTNKGIAVRHIPGHIDLRLHFFYDEIRGITRTDSPDQIPLSWSVLAPTDKFKQGLLLKPRSLDGFSKRIEEVLLTPTDTEEFRKYFPPSVFVS